MLKLHREGLIALPPPKYNHSNHREDLKHPLHTEAGDPKDPITNPVSELMPIVLQRVTKPAESKLWNELIDRYHYLGYTVLKGAQLRYLIKSSKGYVGAIGFSSAAWKVKDRDAWIGWDNDARIANLHYVVNNSRFLILPWVKSKNLASKILGLCASKLPIDWKARYGYTPVLFETFVEKQRFTGTCYKAANWVLVGQTTGRGKWDRYMKKGLPIKDVFLYPLQKNFRSILTKI